MWFAEYLITGKTHQQLAEENYEEIMVLTYGQALKGEQLDVEKDIVVKMPLPSSGKLRR